MNKKKINKEKLVEQIFKPNTNGISKVLTRKQLENTELKLGNNGNIRHNIPYNVLKYKWKITRLNNNSTGKVIKLQTIGFNNNNKCLNRPIDKKIRKTLLDKYKKCIHCGNNKNLCIDHKNDLYNDIRVLNVKTQSITDFQVLCNKCNKDLKHQANVYEKKENNLFIAKQLGIYPFVNDIISYYPWEMKIFDINDINCKFNTYWYDIEEFYRLREIYIKYIPINNEIKKYKFRKTINLLENLKI